MSLIADILLAAGALGAGFYCFILGRRLNRFNDLENGVGGAVAVLSSQVEDLKSTLNNAQKTASGSVATLEELHSRAESVSKRLEIQLAALHDLPEADFDSASEQMLEKPANKATESELMFMRHTAGDH
ncbi:MAG: hypothetical protein ABJM43_10910 [Paracoccaceae bacterium]